MRLHSSRSEHVELFTIGLLLRHHSATFLVLILYDYCSASRTEIPERKLLSFPRTSIVVMLQGSFLFGLRRYIIYNICMYLFGFSRRSLNFGCRLASFFFMYEHICIYTVTDDYVGHELFYQLTYARKKFIRDMATKLIV